MDANIGDIRFIIGDDPAPEDWAFCEGQILPIAQYPMLFSVFQEIFGGDGKMTFGLPDLRCSIPPYSGSVNFIVYIGSAGQHPNIEDETPTSDYLE